MSVAKARKVIVVGAGVSGLLAARRLAASGHDVTVMEADDHVGGRVSRVRVDGFELDAGAESFATRGGHVVKLARELGLGSSLVLPEPKPAWVVTPEEAYPLPADRWLGIPTRLLARDLHRAIGCQGASRMLADLLAPMPNITDDDSIARFMRERLGDAATDRLVAPVLEDIYSRPLEEITLGDIAPGFAEDLQRYGSVVRAAAARREMSPAGSPVMGIEGGVATLVDALADSARERGARIEYGAIVGGLERKGERWVAWVDGKKHQADAVVLAVPRPVVAALVPDVAWAEDRQVAVVTLVLDAPELDAAPRGTGALAVGNVSGATGLTHSTAKWRWLAERMSGRHVVRLSYGIDNARDARLHALNDAATLLGVPLKETQVRDMERVQWADSAPVAIADREPVPGLHLVGSAAGLSGLAAIVGADAALPRDF